MATLSLRIPLWVSKILLPSRDSISCHSFIFSLQFFALSIFSLALRASSSWFLPVYLSLAFVLSLQPYVFPCRPLPGQFSPLRLPLSRRRCLMMGYQISYMFLVSSFIKVVYASEICSCEQLFSTWRLLYARPTSWNSAVGFGSPAFLSGCLINASRR